MPPSMIGPSPAKAWTSKPMPVRGDRRPASHCSARSKSAAVVSFSSAGSPSTAATSMPAARSTVVSSVGEAPDQLLVRVAQSVAGEMPAASARERGRFGRRARPRLRPPRGERVADRRGPVPRLRRIPGCASRRSMTAAGQKGRAASWTSTASPSIAARPARTESARSAPPSIRSPTSSPSSALCGQLLLALCRSRRASIAPRDDRSATSTAQRSTGLPPSERYCLGTPPPRRSPLPAATMRAVTVIRAAL